MNARRCLTVACALAVTGIFALPASSAAPQHAATSERAVVAPVAASAVVDKAKASRRCGCAGRLLDIRSVEATAVEPASYEFTFRMRDGSFHTSRSASVGSWKVGDRVIVLAGQAT